LVLLTPLRGSFLQAQELDQDAQKLTEEVHSLS
jgi:hypothetical protein